MLARSCSIVWLVSWQNSAKLLPCSRRPPSISVNRLATSAGETAGVFFSRNWRISTLSMSMASASIWRLRRWASGSVTGTGSAALRTASSSAD